MVEQRAGDLPIVRFLGCQPRLDREPARINDDVVLVVSRRMIDRDSDLQQRLDHVPLEIGQVVTVHAQAESEFGAVGDPLVRYRPN